MPLTKCIQMHTPSPCWVCQLQHSLERARWGVHLHLIIFLTGASNNHNDSFPFFLSLFSFCALHRFWRARSALSCYPPWSVPFPLPSCFLSLLSALGGIGWRGCVLL